MVEKFIEGNYYKLRNDYPKNPLTPNIVFEGRNTWWDYSNKRDFFDMKPRKFLGNCVFEGINNTCDFYPEDFEESSISLIPRKLAEERNWNVVSKEEEEEQGWELYSTTTDLGTTYTFKFLGKESYESKNKGGNKMELKDIKETNLQEAKKQVEQERNNAETEYAKTQYKRMIDSIDYLDREIKVRTEEKNKLLEELKIFKKSK